MRVLLGAPMCGEPAETAGPDSLPPLHCSRCNAEVPLGPQGEVTCHQCGAAVPLTEAHQQRYESLRDHLHRTRRLGLYAGAHGGGYAWQLPYSSLPRPPAPWLVPAILLALFGGQELFDQVQGGASLSPLRFLLVTVTGPFSAFNWGAEVLSIYWLGGTLLASWLVYAATGLALYYLVAAPTQRRECYGKALLWKTALILGHAGQRVASRPDIVTCRGCGRLLRIEESHLGTACPWCWRDNLRPLDVPVGVPIEQLTGGRLIAPQDRIDAGLARLVALLTEAKRGAERLAACWLLLVPLLVALGWVRAAFLEGTAPLYFRWFRHAIRGPRQWGEPNLPVPDGHFARQVDFRVL